MTLQDDIEAIYKLDEGQLNSNGFKPCPMCQSALIKLFVHKQEADDTYTVVCGDCGLESSAFLSNLYPLDKEEAIKAWNTRPDDAVKSQMVSIIRRLEANQEWQLISTAPKDGSDILIYDDESEYFCVVHWAKSPGDGVWKINAERSGWAYPTHWRPLPQPPKGV